jgi:hypothetical protein
MPINFPSGASVGPQTAETEDIGNHDNRTDLKGHSLPARQRQVSAGLAGLLEIREMTQQVARHSDRRTIIALAQVTRATRLALGPEYLAALFERDASTINTGQAFHEALASLSGIPENFRDGPLCELYRRIRQLPSSEQQAALDAWLPIAQQRQNRSSSLDDLVRAGAEGLEGMRWAPARAVQRGENVLAVAQRHGITGREHLISLQTDSVNGPAGAAVRAGQKVQAVAQRHGITEEHLLRMLQQVAVSGPAGAAVQVGEAFRPSPSGSASQEHF